MQTVKMSSKKPLKIVFYSMDGVGHVNACIGLAQALKQRGHEIIFFTSPMFAGQYEKFGFKTVILSTKDKSEMMKKQEGDGNAREHPLKAIPGMLEGLRKSGLLSGKPPIEKLESFDHKNKESFQYKMYEEIKEIHPQIKDAVEHENPDLIIVDHFCVAPCIAYGEIPWAFLFSGNPAFFFESPELPPVMSGYPSNDRTGWDEFREKFDSSFKYGMRYFQNLLNRDLGYPEVDSNQFLFKSPYMNIYGYPQELDYTDVVPLPDNFVQVDAFCRETPEPFELPEEFKAKIKPGDKLVYLSMGSMGSIDVDLMKKLVNALSKSPHKFIVSMGPLHEQLKLPENMWGKAFLPQTKVLPLVDMVMTHGGNNSVTESFSFGKPMLVMPLFADQYDNAQRITEKGFGYRIDPYNCTDEELRSMVDKILQDEDMRKRCEKAAQRMKETDSKTRACEKIERIVEKVNSTKA